MAKPDTMSPFVIYARLKWQGFFLTEDSKHCRILS